MKPLLITLGFSLASSFVILHSSLPAKPVGPCEPYAEKCRHCTDCSQCKHCAVDKGFCSVCFKK